MDDHQARKTVTVWDYDTQTVSRYQREGECSECGLCCCKGLMFSVARPIESQNLRQGGKATTGHGAWVEIYNNGERCFFRMRGYQPSAGICTHLDASQHCKIYPERSTLCREWPFSPADIADIQACSYTFTCIGAWTFDQIGLKKVEKMCEKVICQT